MFYMGQYVEWTSQASGTTSQKTGKIVFVVAPGEKPPKVFKSLYRNRGVQDVRARDEESYVVFANDRHYWPRVSALALKEDDLVNDDSQLEDEEW